MSVRLFHFFSPSTTGRAKPNMLCIPRQQHRCARNVEPAPQSLNGLDRCVPKEKGKDAHPSCTSSLSHQLSFTRFDSRIYPTLLRFSCYPRGTKATTLAAGMSTLEYDSSFRIGDGLVYDNHRRVNYGRGYGYCSKLTPTRQGRRERRAYPLVLAELQTMKFS